MYDPSLFRRDLIGREAGSYTLKSPDLLILEPCVPVEFVEFDGAQSPPL